MTNFPFHNNETANYDIHQNIPNVQHFKIAKSIVYSSHELQEIFTPLNLNLNKYSNNFSLKTMWRRVLGVRVSTIKVRTWVNKWSGECNKNNKVVLLCETDGSLPLSDGLDS